MYNTNSTPILPQNFLSPSFMYPHKKLFFSHELSASAETQMPPKSLGIYHIAWWTHVICIQNFRQTMHR